VHLEQTYVLQNLLPPSDISLLADWLKKFPQIMDTSIAAFTLQKIQQEKWLHHH